MILSFFFAEYYNLKVSLLKFCALSLLSFAIKKLLWYLSIEYGLTIH